VELAHTSQQPDQTVDYTSNLYSVEAPEGGAEASGLHVYIAWLNQSAWVYDPLYQSWWRYVDYADPASAGVVHSEIDRLTGRQLHFENVIVLFAQHEVISPTNLEIRMEQDWLGDALLFRDGEKFDIRWSGSCIRTTRRHSRSSRGIPGSSSSHPRRQLQSGQQENGCCSFLSRRGRSKPLR
jgi:hypothetical protein